VYDDDLVTLMESSGGDDLKDTYALDYLIVSSGKGTVPTATVRIAVDGKTLQAAACGDGAVDAATKAIDEIVGYKIKIDDFRIDAVTEGREAQAKVKIRASSSDGTFVGVGLSTDIVEASANAYMDIVNKIARMKKYNRKIPKLEDI
jgi:2-isopropylmalate synthase